SVTSELPRTQLAGEFRASRTALSSVDPPLGPAAIPPPPDLATLSLMVAPMNSRLALELNTPPPSAAWLPARVKFAAYGILPSSVPQQIDEPDAYNPPPS